MKPVTAQDYAKCYGTFIANINKFNTITSRLTTWFSANFPDISTMSKLNPSVFMSYPPTITLPKQLNISGQGSKAAIEYNRSINALWAQLTVNLKSAMMQAELDPTLSNKLLISFAKQQPADKNPSLQ